MNHMIKNVGAVFVIILLLPYVITTFFSGGLEFQEQQDTDDKSTEESTMVAVQEEDSVVRISLQDYLMGVIAADIPITYESETLKVQAVIIRTSVEKALQENTDQIFDASDGYLSLSEMEEYWGYDGFLENYEKLETAVKETEDEVMKYEGDYIEAAFHSISNGATRSGKEALQSEDYPYLTSVSCEDDKRAEDYLQSVTYSYEEFASLCGATDLTALPQIIQTDSASYALKIKAGNVTMTGEELRKKCNLASSSMIISEVDGQIKIVTKGVGHGVGLSQYEANAMAKQGKSYEEILTYFYKNIEITNE